MDARIKDINDSLEAVGSKFRTEDGLTIMMYIGHLTFLRRTYESTEALEAAVEKIGRCRDVH